MGLFILAFVVGAAAILLVDYERFLDFAKGASRLIGQAAYWLLIFTVVVLPFTALEAYAHELTSAEPSLGKAFGLLFLAIPASIGSIFKGMGLPGLIWTLWKGVGLGCAFLLPSLAVFGYRFFHVQVVPHPVEKVLAKRDELPREEVVEKVSESMYKRERDGLPSEWHSESRRQRVRKVTELVEAENTLMKKIIENLKLRSRLGR
jgi:hypothetical protein